MNKKFVALLLTMMLSANTVVASSGITIRLNNKVIETTVAPIIQNGSTLVPIRVISEALGAKVNWHSETKTIIIVQEDTNISMTVGNETAIVNGQSKVLTAPIIHNSTTMWCP